MKNPEILVQVDNSMPFGELLQQNNDPNISIKRSAHVGNMFGADLILSALGMNMIFVDANYGQKDKLYFPQFIVDGVTDPEVIACSQTLSLANTTNEGASLNDQCTSSIIKAFGNDRLIPDSVFITKNLVTAEQILDIVLRKFPNPEILFTRQVTADGKPIEIKNLPSDINDVLLLGDDPTKGTIIPNALNILIDFIVEAQQYDTDSITHISGPTMVNYIKTKMPVMNEIYQLLVSAGMQLPEILKVRLVPAAGVRFVVAASQAQTLDELIGLQAELQQTTNSIKSFKSDLARLKIKRTKEEYREIDLPKKTIAKELARILGLVPELFFVVSPETNTPTFTSQYTALNNGADGSSGAGLYIPKIVLEKPIAEVSSLFAELEKFRRKNEQLLKQ